MTYVVQAGDTMWSIAQRFGVPLSALIAANPQIKDPNLIYPGQTIHISGVSGGITLRVFAAISLKDVLPELRNMYGKNHPHVNIACNFGASGDLQRQVVQGEPVDIYTSAAATQMDALAAAGLIMESTRKDLVGNTLVLITRKNGILTSFLGLAGLAASKIGIGNPATVPAGMYAKESLEFLGLWDIVQPMLVLGQDVRQVLTYVETGYAVAGLVYGSDAMAGKGIITVATAPGITHEPIRYPIAVVKGSRYPDEAQAFTAFLCGREAAAVFARYGFTPMHA